MRKWRCIDVSGTIGLMWQRIPVAMCIYARWQMYRKQNKVRTLCVVLGQAPFAQGRGCERAEPAMSGAQKKH